MAINKTDAIKEIIAKYGINETAAAELLSLTNKMTASTTDTPDIIVDGEITERYCNLHKAYEPIADFGNSKKKECKAGVWRWNQINKLMTQIVTRLMDSETSLKKADYDSFKEEYNELKNSRIPGNNGYNIDRDWSEYLSATTKKTEES